MRFPGRTLTIAGLGVVLILTVALLLFLRISHLSPGTMLKILSSQADLEAINVDYLQVGGADEKWEVRAKKARYLKKENRAFFDFAEVKLFLADGRTIDLVGEKGQVNTLTGDMEISGKVVITGGSGERFATSYLQYNAAEKRLHTEAAVEMETPRMRVDGVGMSLSLENRAVFLLSKVRARIM